LKKAGATVQSIASVGKGCPDILVGFRGWNYVMEIKTKDGKLTPMELTWHRAWAGRIYIVRDVETALIVIGAIK
jgi:hypothetical protein